MFFNSLFKYEDIVKTNSMPSGFYETFNEIKQIFDESDITQKIYTKTSMFATVVTIFLISAVIILGFMKIISNIWAVFTGLAVLIMFFNIMPKRTKESSKILAKITGFRNFIEKAKKDELERLVHDNPNYFYDILPYVYVLGVSNEWIIQFQDVALPQIEDIMKGDAVRSKIGQIIFEVIADLDYKNWWKDL